MEHVMEVPNPNEHLLERILSTENDKAAWKRVKAAVAPKNWTAVAPKNWTMC